MGEDNNGVTSVMTEGYDYISIVRCKNCGKKSVHDYGFDMEWDPCPHYGQPVGVRTKKEEKQSTLKGLFG